MRCAIFAVALLFSLEVLGAPLGYQRVADLEWVCGGVGAEERRSLVELGKSGNLELLMVTAGRGGFVAGVELTLYAVSPERTVLRAIAEGPTCHFKLKPGTYRIQARLGGVQREGKAAVKAGGTRAWIVLTFPDEPGENIRATEEEKRQARQP